MDPLAATPASPDTKKGDKSSTTDDDPPEEIARKRAEIASGSAGLKAAPGGPMAECVYDMSSNKKRSGPDESGTASSSKRSKSSSSTTTRTRATDETATEADSELNLTIPAPPEQSYVSRKECYDSIQKWALENGYAIATARSYPFKGSTRVVYQCDKSSYYRPHRKYVNDTLDDENLDAQPDNTQEAKEHEKDPLGEKKNNPLDAPRDNKQEKKDLTALKPKTNVGLTRKAMCPFRLNLTHNLDTDKWDLEIKNSAHNHVRSDHPTSHIIHQRLTADQIEEARKFRAAGVMPIKTKNSLMKSSSTPLMAPLRAIHNFNYREKKKELEGRSPMLAVIDCLRSKSFNYQTKSTFDVRTGSDHLSALFFTLPESLELALKHPYCLQIDAT